MDKVNRATRRTDLTLVLSGLGCLAISLAVAFWIWNHPYAGPDLRSEFSMFMAPVFMLGLSLSLWGSCSLSASRKQHRQSIN
ncbi:hypothetical protein ACLPJG_26620 [Pseudomonas aeruginosa]|jgi:hypothetical protein|uniref:Uncharacterized protein n=2 Tax=Pseudomonas TaxID=286 RepID=A0ABD4YLT8_9PSED|nr:MULTISPECIES: hypothetical protein [Pseudomonas]RFP99709.1 hypothetical protein D0O09_21095 [Pseudomonas putida]TXG95533.1 MAG: hypothetical protein E6R08_11480 [Nevskiaceae bacterium]AGZ38133.1 hypothetical protein PVLB_26982 [Pseudomonas sp. VLB120]MCF3157311.1 hypothetical protein [Pseudomonas juntendi]MDH0760464.1 hypothetical protein [Pseudomonas juntendi]